MFSFGNKRSLFMKIAFAEQVDADIAAFVVDENGTLPAAARSLDEVSDSLLTEALDRTATFHRELDPSEVERLLHPMIQTS